MKGSQVQNAQTEQSDNQGLMEKIFWLWERLMEILKQCVQVILFYKQ